jgi:hypothetical protein
MELDDEASVLLAIGDHNFPDLQQFALATDVEDQSPKESVEIEQVSAPPRLSLNDLLNPASNKDEAGVPDYEEIESDGTSAFSYDMSSYTNMSEGYCDWGSSGPASEPQTDSEGLSAGGTMDVDDVGGDEDSFRVNTPTASSEDGMDVGTDTSSLSKSMSLRDVFLPGRTGTGEGSGIIPFKAPQPTKRPRARVESDSSNQSDSSGYGRRSKVAKGEGKSRSGVAARARQEKLKRGELELKQKELETWKNKLLADDPKVEFHPTDPRRVRHSTCGSKVTMKYVCDATRWREHLKKCKAKKTASADTPSLMTMGWTKRAVKSEVKRIEKTCPCPGITTEDDKRVEAYLGRTGVLGGGARSVKVIAEEMFRKLFSKLGKRGKKDVLDAQRHEQKWRNDHDNMRVFAAACKKTTADRAPNRPLPCGDCAAVLKSKAFTNALRKPAPEEKNYIYTNHRFRSPLLGAIYARTVGLKDLIETPVRCNYLVLCHSTNPIISGCEDDSLCSICSGCS